MLKVYAKGFLKTKTTQGSKAKENEGTLKKTKFPHILDIVFSTFIFDRFDGFIFEAEKIFRKRAQGLLQKLRPKQT